MPVREILADHDMYFCMNLGLGFMFVLEMMRYDFLPMIRVLFHESDINLSEHELYKFN